MITSSATTMNRGMALLAEAAAQAFHEPCPEPVAELLVSTAISRQDLGRLLDSLADEDSAHSWKNFGRDGSPEDLLRWENKHRPTEIFFFYLSRGEDLQVVGAGAVAEHLNARFTDPGFCVLGRCYIMAKFRNRGLYRRLLQLRLEHCRARFGDALKAIHVGSDNPRIAHVIAHHNLPGWGPFLHLGEEELAIAGRSKLVNAYLLLMPDFARSVDRALEGLDALPAIAALRRRLAGQECAEGRNIGLAIRDAVAAAAQQPDWPGGRDTVAIHQILAFCGAVPLFGFQ
jgi:GNAT superfamily N-acetyltransferase